MLPRRYVATQDDKCGRSELAQYDGLYKQSINGRREREASKTLNVPILALFVHLRVEIAVIKNDGVCTSQTKVKISIREIKDNRQNGRLT